MEPKLQEAVDVASGSKISQANKIVPRPHYITRIIRLFFCYLQIFHPDFLS